MCAMRVYGGPHGQCKLKTHTGQIGVRQIDRLRSINSAPDPRVIYCAGSSFSSRQPVDILVIKPWSIYRWSGSFNRHTLLWVVCSTAGIVIKINLYWKLYFSFIKQIFEAIRNSIRFVIKHILSNYMYLLFIFVI